MGSQPAWPPFQPYQDCSQGLCNLYYCPQFCNFLFPPPPAFDPAESGGPTISPLGIALIALAAAAFVLFGYYAIIYRHCRRRPPSTGHPADSAAAAADTSAAAADPQDPSQQHGLDEALINKITVRRYRRGDGLVGGAANCTVCLSEFREEESLRLLPKCRHTFHVQCIDTWLKSHPNCPLCRAAIVWAPPESQANEAALVVTLQGSGSTSSLEGDDEGGSKVREVGTIQPMRLSVSDDDDDDDHHPSTSSRSHARGRSGVLPL